MGWTRCQTQNHTAGRTRELLPAEVDDQVALGGEPHVAVVAPKGFRVVPAVGRQLGRRDKHFVAVFALVGNLNELSSNQG